MLCNDAGQYVFRRDFYFKGCFRFKFKILIPNVVIVIKYFEFKPKTKKKVKITTMNILSQIVTQDICLNKFIQFKFHKNVQFFKSKSAKLKGKSVCRYKMLLFYASEQIRNFLYPRS